ncbi:MAG: hypothetical protein AB1327_11535, partial [Bacillota bacterium]
TEARPYRSHPLKRDDAFKILYAEGFEPQLLHALQQTLGGTEIRYVSDPDFEVGDGIKPCTT